MSDSETEEHLVKVLWATDDSYGFTKGKSYAARVKNYERRTSFRLKPIAFVADEHIPSIQYLVKYFTSQREYRVTIPESDKNDFKAVCTKLMNQNSGELAEGSLSQADFKRINVKHFNLWSERAFVRKQPVRYIGLQRHLLTNFVDWTPDQLEFFFSEEIGVLGINGRPKPDAQTVYVKEIMKNVPKMECSLSGYPGFAKHVEPPYTINQGGDVYFESVNCSANIAMMTFHAAWYREKFGKLGMICIAGPPNIAKTSSLKVAMHMASSSNYFFSMKTTPELIQSVCEWVGLMVSYDDNDSLRKEEVLGVSRFDGGVIGSKGQGIKKMVGEVVLTSNDVSKRSEKMKLGRVFVLKKRFPGYSEGENMLEALVNLAELNDALKDPKKPLDFLVSTTSLWFKTVKVPESASNELKGKEASQMLIWFAQTCQIIRDLTGNSLREIFTIAALNMWVFLYDQVLPPLSAWHANGGSVAYFRNGGYFHLLLLEELDVYGQPLGNPETGLEERFMNFVLTILSKIDSRLRESDDPKVSDSPGDLIPEVKLVWSKPSPSSEKDICIAFVKTVNFKKVFRTDDPIAIFEDFVKENGGRIELKVASDFQGKKTHSAVAIGLKYFEQASQKRMIKMLVRTNIQEKCKLYGSIRRKRRAEERRQDQHPHTDSDYNDTDTDDETEEAQASRKAPVSKKAPVSRKAVKAVTNSETEEHSEAPPAPVATEIAVQPPQQAAAEKDPATNADTNDETEEDYAAQPASRNAVTTQKDPTTNAEKVAADTNDYDANGAIAKKNPPIAATSGTEKDTIPEKSSDLTAETISSSNPKKTPAIAIEMVPCHVPAEEQEPASSVQASLLSEIAPTTSSEFLESQLSSLPPGPSSQSSILTSVLSSQGLQGDLLGFLSSMPLDGLSRTVVDAVFDPESIEKETLSEESDDTDEGDAFRQKAFSAGKKSPARMVRTRSQTSQSNSVDLTGKVVFAHKGKSIPCFFPGKVLRKTRKGLEVEFFSQLGVHTCTEKNTMLYDDFFLKRGDSSSTLFKVPEHLKEKFEEGLKLASKQ